MSKEPQKTDWLTFRNMLSLSQKYTFAGGHSNHLLSENSREASFLVHTPNGSRRVVTIFRSQRPEAELEQEIRCIQLIGSDKIVQIGKFFSIGSDGFYGVERDYISGKSLSLTDRSPWEPFSLRRIIPFALDILSALIEIHYNKLVHRYVEPRYLHLLPFDCGMLTTPPQLDQQAPDNCGCERSYRDPQIDRFGWSPSADLFGLSVCLWELATGEHPYEDRLPLPGILPQNLQIKGRKEVAPLAALFMHTMAPCKGDRHVTASLMAQALVKIAKIAQTR